MFVDASAIIAVIAGEEDCVALASRLATADILFVSPIVVYEAIAGLARKRACPIRDATALVQTFIEETEAQSIDITAEIGHRAMRAFDTFGKGRHTASLNMGDCFAYACAQALQVPLLFKGNDFVHTDIAIP